MSYVAPSMRRLTKIEIVDIHILVKSTRPVLKVPLREKEGNYVLDSRGEEQ